MAVRWSYAMPQVIDKPNLEELQRINLFWRMEDCFQVSTNTAALMLKKSPATLKKWRTQGIGPRYTRGSPVTYSIGDLKQYLSDQKSRKL